MRLSVAHCHMFYEGHHLSVPRVLARPAITITTYSAPAAHVLLPMRQSPVGRSAPDHMARVKSSGRFRRTRQGPEVATNRPVHQMPLIALRAAPQRTPRPDRGEQCRPHPGTRPSRQG
eukprot:gene15426-biopygen6273